MISVIVPIYNCEAYLKEGLQSLVHQTIFDKLDIICVNDGSTDASAEIVRGYVRQYSNIRLIEQTNQGVSAARNRGMREATGQYIAFFDADDLAQETLYEELLRQLVDHDADMGCVNYSMRFEDGVTKVHKPAEQAVLDRDEALQSFLSSGVIGINIFDKLFKASIAKGIEFPEGYAVGEDMDYVFRYLIQSNRVAIDTSKSLYSYHVRSGSAMKSSFSKKYFDPVVLSKRMMEALPQDSSLRPYAEANWIHECCKALALYYQSGSKDFRQEISECREHISTYSITKARRYLSKKHFISLVLMRLSPRLYLYIYKMLRIG